jgi:two-component system OmpR family sensor kinase
VSLRTRLLLALLGLVAAGLLVAGVATYSSLRSFLLERVDQQLREARAPVAMTLASTQIPGLPDQPGGGQGPPNLPPGTYGELRSIQGVILNKISFAYGSETQPTPRLPSPLPGATSQNDRGTLFDTGATSGNGPRFRVLVQAVPQVQRVLIVAVPLAEATQTLARLLGIEILVFALVLVGLAVAAWLLIKRDLRPLEAMADTAGEIAAGDLSQRVEPAEPRTEVGRLGLSLNAMLEQIEVAFAERAATEEKLRRFLADASHELRTPLTSIRGYAEVFERGAKDDPEDLATAMRRIEEESRRMGVMVDELLLLARLGEGREPERRAATSRSRRRRSSSSPATSTSSARWSPTCSATPASTRLRTARCVCGCRARPETRARPAKPSSRWPTKGRASRPRSRPRCSSPSTAPTSRGRGSPAAPASASPSSPRSSKRTAGRSR